jgi:hypothetical protein
LCGRFKIVLELSFQRLSLKTMNDFLYFLSGWANDTQTAWYFVIGLFAILFVMDYSDKKQKI